MQPFTSPKAHERLTAVVVEPDALVRDLLATALRRLNFDVATSANGQEALALCRKQPPRLLVSEIWLPRLSGLEMLRLLKKEGCLENTIVMVISSLAFAEVVTQARTLGAHEFLVKPINPEDFISRVQHHLNAWQTFLNGQHQPGL